MADTSFFRPTNFFYPTHFSRVKSVNDGKLVFLDGHKHEFRDPAWLNQALEMTGPTWEHLRATGERVMKELLLLDCDRETRPSDSDLPWQWLWTRGMVLKEYRAWQADAVGVSRVMLWRGMPVNSLGQEQCDRKAGMVEALIGAIAEDEGPDYLNKVRMAMRRLGFLWPRWAEERKELEGYIGRLKDMGMIPRS